MKRSPIKKTGMIAGKPAAQYWQEIRRKSYEKSKKKAKPRKPLPRNNARIKPRSSKRAEQEKDYYVLREQFLLDNPICQCNRQECVSRKLKYRKATQVHHKAGRIGKMLTDVRYFLAVTDECHRWIELHPKEAKELGLSINRLSKPSIINMNRDPKEQGADEQQLPNETQGETTDTEQTQQENSTQEEAGSGDLVD